MSNISEETADGTPSLAADTVNSPAVDSTKLGATACLMLIGLVGYGLFFAVRRTRPTTGDTKRRT